MTKPSEKIRALMLSVFVIASVVAVPGLSVMGTAAATSSTGDVTNLTGGDIVWDGQTINISATNHPYSAGETVQLRMETSSGSEFVQQLTVGNNGHLVLDTSNIKKGHYYFENSSGTVYPDSNGDGNADAFEIVEQSITVKSSDTVKNGGDGSLTTAEVDISSNRAAGYDLVISEANGALTAKEIASIVTDATTTTDANGNTIAVVNNYDEKTLKADFSGVEKGTYSFNVDVRDTTASSSFDITVEEQGDGQAVLAQQTVSTHQGGVAKITIQFKDGQRDATVVVGDKQDAGYEANFSVQANSDVKEVTVLMNTYTAGDGKTGTSTYTLADPDKGTLTINSETTLPDGSKESLDPADYSINVNTAGTTDSIGAVIIADQGISGVSTHVAPPTTAGSLADAEDVQKAVKNGKITERQNVANGDAIVYALDAKSLEGPLAQHGDFQSLINNGVIAFNIAETDASADMNDQPKVVDLSASTYTTVHDAENDVLYVVFDTADIEFKNTNEGVEAGETYNVKAQITGEALLDGDKAKEHTVTTQTSVEKRTFEFADSVTVYPETKQSISADTNIAPGSEVTVQVRSTDDTTPGFVKSTTVAVTEGSVTGTFDFSGQSAGDAFTVTATGPSETTYTTEGKVVKAPEPANLKVTNVEAPSEVKPGATAELTLTVKNTGEKAGTSSYEVTVAGESVDTGEVEVAGGETQTVTVEFTAPEDSESESLAYGVSLDGESASSGDVTIKPEQTETTSTTTETTTTTTETTEKQTPKETTSSGQAPGFGVGIAISALLGAALLAARRRDE